MERVQPLIEAVTAYAARQATAETLGTIAAAFALGYLLRALISRRRRKAARREARGW